MCLPLSDLAVNFFPAGVSCAVCRWCGASYLVVLIGSGRAGQGGGTPALSRSVCLVGGRVARRCSGGVNGGVVCCVRRRAFRGGLARRSAETKRTLAFSAFDTWASLREMASRCEKLKHRDRDTKRLASSFVVPCRLRRVGIREGLGYFRGTALRRLQGVNFSAGSRFQKTGKKKSSSRVQGQNPSP